MPFRPVHTGGQPVRSALDVHIVPGIVDRYGNGEVRTVNRILAAVAQGHAQRRAQTLVENHLRRAVGMATPDFQANVHVADDLFPVTHATRAQAGEYAVLHKPAPSLWIPETARYGITHDGDELLPALELVDFR